MKAATAGRRQKMDDEELLPGKKPAPAKQVLGDA